MFTSMQLLFQDVWLITQTLRALKDDKNTWSCPLVLFSCRKGENVREMLNDKRHIAEQKARYHTYETVVDEVIVEPGESATAYELDDYDDEYDDTYDMNQVGANDLDGDSLLTRRYLWCR